MTRTIRVLQSAALRWLSLSLCIAVCAALTGCTPYEFTMGSRHITRCSVLTSLAGVDQGTRYATLRDTAAIDMNYYGATQYLLTMDVKAMRGEGFRVLLRPVVEQRAVIDSGLILTVTNEGTTLVEHGTLRARRPDVVIRPGQQMHLSLLSENGYLQIALGCDTVFKGTSAIKESDDVVVQALERSEVQLIQPDWSGLPDR